ncbi:MAG: flippase-like domain-containing protein [Calditrichaceae bacterium]|nr:flippase-like domain-containing protein [Calditrichia bacterium]NUQ42153.1 flippase-like domain-containing protein [Calditrichaceae bacterium]
MHVLIKMIASFGGTAIFMYLAFKNIHLPSFWESLSDTGWLLIVGASAMTVVSMLLRAWRWQILLSPLKKVPYFSAFTFTMIGFMGNNVLPAHAGEVIKPYLLGKKEGISGFSALATVLIERVLDCIALITLFLSVLFFVPLPFWMKTGGLAAGFGSLALLFLMITLASGESRMRDKLFRLNEKFPGKIRSYTHRHLITFLEGLAIFKRRAALFPLIGISLLIWLHMSATAYLILKGYPMAGPAGANLWLAAVVVVVFLAFAIVLPSSPGYLGITQWGFKIALGLFAINEIDALGCSVIFSLTQYVPVTAGGIILLMKEGMSFKYLRSSARTQHETLAPEALLPYEKAPGRTKP